MKMTILNKQKLGLGLMLMLLFLAGSCKKDEQQEIVIPFKIAGYYPNSGNAGTLVNIEGEGFGTDIGQYSATVSGKTVTVVSATATRLVLRMPEAGISGVLSLKYNDQQYDVGQYLYQDLSVKTVFPANGPAGSQIRITGEGFSSTQGPVQVLINGKVAQVVSVSETIIVAEVPSEAGFGPVTIKVNGKEAQGQNFTYQAISSIKPLTGGKNTRVTISGVGFEETIVGNTVNFNGVAATVIEAGKERLVVVAPDGVSTGPLTVDINGQKTIGPVFKVVSSPILQFVSPLSGPKGVEMVITGSVFSTILDENKVFINNVEVPLKSASATELILNIPGGTGSGVVRVVVNDQSTNGPQFKDQTLGISSISPDNGLTGTEVTIKGSGFSAVAEQNKVYFNGVLAGVRSATENTITINAPANVTTGEVKIAVNGQEATAPTEFRRAGMSTLAGGPNSNVFGSFMTAIAVDGIGNVYVVDPQNKAVKKITPAGIVSTLQANGTNVEFDNPYGLVIDKDNTIYISERNRNQIKKITSSGQITTIALTFSPALISIDNTGNLYVNNNALFGGVYKVNTAGAITKMNGPSWANSRSAIDVVGNFYYSDQGTNSNHSVIKVPAGGQMEINFAGTSDPGYMDAVGQVARFNTISGGVIFKDNNTLYVGDGSNYGIRELNINTRSVSTVFKASSGFADGTLSAARLGRMVDIAADKDGNIYILDAGNKAVRKVFLK
ncbi:hypothetical protein G7074_19890 [Pedobacter sp. HDW13]|uniref:IPT/TIG domain-containing protein n=1 Tax=Pedobacter sp. HDW13 TaxID=2714940 RepID=UPI00140D6311|nr:IPT/TIG domain-containing protein [Pedobacter sp. HDW13]QIL41324.1 hypothetical protein G7074_19890 [Pedobacter sp. HDW13]